MDDLELVLGAAEPAAAAATPATGGEQADGQTGDVKAAPEKPAPGVPAARVADNGDRDRRYERLESELQRQTQHNERLSNELMQILRGRQAPAPAEGEADIPGDQLIDALARDGTKALKRFGLLTPAEARRIADEAVERAINERVPKVIEERIGQEVKANNANSAIVRQFPWLGDANDQRNASMNDYFQALQAEDPEGAKVPEVRRYMLRSAAAAADADYKGRQVESNKRTERIGRQSTGGQGGSDVAPAEPTLDASGRDLAAGLGLSVDSIEKAFRGRR